MDRGRVAELLVALGRGSGVGASQSRRRGSGYRLTSTTVLTAWHVVAGASSAVVRFDAGTPKQVSMEAVAQQRIGESDLAVVSIEGPVGEPPVPACALGRIPDAATVLNAQAAGFPRWKLRQSSPNTLYRTLCHLEATVPTLANHRDDALEVVVNPPAADPQASPWEGMSGGPLWVDGAIVAVLIEHHPREGLGRLAALRVDRALSGLDPEQRELLLPLLGLVCLTDLVEVGAGTAAGTQVNVATSGAMQFNVQHGNLNIVHGQRDSLR